MEIFNNLATGFAVALTPINLLYCFLGSFIGTAIGVLPGLGPPATIALLLPVTYGIPATSAVILLAGIFYGAMNGGSTTSILLNIDRKSTRLNSSHGYISYAVFCLKKKKKPQLSTHTHS